jgi:hypothetical protein
MLAGSADAEAPAAAAVLMTDCCTAGGIHSACASQAQGTAPIQPQPKIHYDFGVMWHSINSTTEQARPTAQAMHSSSLQHQDDSMPEADSALSSHLHGYLRHALCGIGLQLRKDRSHSLPSPEACGRVQFVAVLLVGIDCCQVIKLCTVQGSQILIDARRHTPLAWAVVRADQHTDDARNSRTITCAFTYAYICALAADSSHCRELPHPDTACSDQSVS